MKRDYFIMHLEACGCTLIREDKKGYSAYRHARNKTKSGVPKGEDLSTVTVCIICITLGIDPPLDMIENHEIIKRMKRDTDESA